MKLSRRTFLKSGLAGAAWISCGVFAPAGKWRRSFAAAPKTPTTLTQTVLPVPVPATSPKLAANEISRYAQYGYGAWQAGDGLDFEKRLDLMPVTYAPMPVTRAAKLLRFFAITDIHITDKEAPTQLIYSGLKDHVSSAYSGVMLYTTHVLDAAIQTVNAIHRENPIDFGISLGDTCNNTQYNETRWYIDILDGKLITPSSGAHAGADSIDYQKPYQATGLDQSIPWYQALGNHDHFWLGTFPVDDYIRQTYIGENIINMGDILRDPLGPRSRGFYMGALDGRTPNGDVFGAGLVADFTTPPKVLAADPNRRSLVKKEWMGEFFTTTSNPVGHGFKRSNVTEDFACYSFEPKANLPIKVIVLDDTQRDEDPDLGGYKTGYGHGSLDKKRYEWLVGQLEQGQAEGKLMIIAAHVPIGVEKEDSYVGWSSSSYVRESALIDKLREYPNLILWVAGHRHVNVVIPLKSPDPARPELGFWQIETSSLRDFPQQFRTFEIVRNSDNTISIFTTDVDPIAEEESLVAKSRINAVAVYEIFQNQIPLAPTCAYNAELVQPLSAAMQAKIARLGTSVQS